jgi:hypothetical protein
VRHAGYTLGVSAMAKKQATIKETAAPASVTSPARAAKPNTPRVTAAKHSKVVSNEPVLPTEPVLMESAPIETAVVQASSGNSEEAIAKIAYSYWESRGYQGGSPLDDWARAEHEYRQRLTATRL